MSLDKSVRGAVKTLSKVVKSLKSPIIHRAFISQNALGKTTYDDDKTLYAIVQKQVQRKVMHDGQMAAIQAIITFVDQIPPNGAPGRQEPIDPRDLLILPDGSSSPIAFMTAEYDSALGPNSFFFLEVWLGVRWTRG